MWTAVPGSCSKQIQSFRKQLAWEVPLRSGKPPGKQERAAEEDHCCPGLPRASSSRWSCCSCTFVHGLHRQGHCCLEGGAILLPISANVAELFPTGIAPCGKSKGDFERDRRGTAESCWLARTRRLQCPAHPEERNKTRRWTGRQLGRLGAKSGSRRYDSVPQGFQHAGARG